MSPFTQKCNGACAAAGRRMGRHEARSHPPEVGYRPENPQHRLLWPLLLGTLRSSRHSLVCAAAARRSAVGSGGFICRGRDLRVAPGCPERPQRLRGARRARADPMEARANLLHPVFGHQSRETRQPAAALAALSAALLPPVASPRALRLRRLRLEQQLFWAQGTRIALEEEPLHVEDGRMWPRRPRPRPARASRAVGGGRPCCVQRGRLRPPLWRRGDRAGAAQRRRFRSRGRLTRDPRVRRLSLAAAAVAAAAAPVIEVVSHLRGAEPASASQTRASSSATSREDAAGEAAWEVGWVRQGAGQSYPREE